MANGFRTGGPSEFNKGRSSKFHEGSQIRQTPEEGRGTCWLKRCGNNKDEDDSPKPLMIKREEIFLAQFTRTELLQTQILELERTRNLLKQLLLYKPKGTQEKTIYFLKTA